MDQVELTHTNMLSTFMEQADNQLDTALAYIYNMARYESDPLFIANKTDEAPVQYAKIRLQEDMEKKLLTNNFVDGFFVRIREVNDYIDFIPVNNKTHFTIKQDKIKDFAESRIASGHDTTRWQLCRIDDEPYLFAMISSPDGIWAGSFVRLSNLLVHFSVTNETDSHFLMLPTADMAAYEQTLTDDMQIISYGSSSADFSVIETFSRDEILNTLPFMQKYTLLLSVIIVIVILLFLLLVYRIVTAPLFRLMDAMNRIQDGDLDYRIADVPASSEIRLINRTFNQMISEVQHLKIDVYEEKIKVQKSQLRNLQLQIKPHFLINSLNMVYNLIETKSLALAQRLIQCSINYFRYMVRVDKDLVALDEEIAHIQAYQEIQTIRYEGRFTYSVEIDAMIRDMLVPPVMIQGLVENSLKYGISADQTLHVRLRVDSFEENDYPFARIVVSDTGPGYPPEDLARLNAGGKLHREDGTHIGIYNITQRLKLMFGEQARWRFYNDGGAVSEIILPATFAEDGDFETGELDEA